MNEGTINELNDEIFNLELEGTYYYQDEEKKDDYFIAWKLVVTASDDGYDIQSYQDDIRSEFDEDLMFTQIGPNHETFRIVGLPKIEEFEFENSIGTLFEYTDIEDAIEFLKNLKTINFSDLKSTNINGIKNFKYVLPNEIEESDTNKTVIVKSHHENGAVKEEIETVNDKLHGIYKQYHDNGQLRVVTRFENGRQVDGVVDSFDENGMLIRTVEVKNGNKNGPFKEFYPSGTIKKEGKYKDDEIIGKSTEYFEDGSIKDEFYLVNEVMIESSAFEQSDFYKFFIKKTEEVLLNLDIKDKSIYDFYYDLETIETTIIIGDKENILLNFAEIRIYSNKCEDQDDEHDSLGEIETPFIISYSSEIEDYILLTNFPKYVIDEDADNMNNDTGIRNLTFDELVNTFNEMKVIDMSKIKINDSDDFTYFEGGSIKEDNADEQIEVLESGIINSLVFNDKTAFVDKLKNLDESSIIEIRFDSKKWSINEKSIVTGDWNEKEYTLYADVLQKRADLMWEESLGELINLLAKNELGELNNDNCKSLYLDSSDGSDINVLKIEWDSSLTDEEEEQFKDEYGDDGSQLYYDGDLEVELFFEIGAIIGVRVITENEELYLSAEDNEIEEEEEEEGNKENTARAMVLLDDEDKKEMENTGWLLHILAFGYFLTGDFISAIASIDKVIKLDIDEECESSEHYTTRAKIYLKLDNNEKAIEDLKKALELDPDNEEAFELLMNIKPITTEDFAKIKDSINRKSFQRPELELYLKQVSNWIEKFDTIDKIKSPISKPELIFLKIQLSLVLQLEEEFFLPLYFELCEEHPDFEPKNGEVLGVLLLKGVKEQIEEGATTSEINSEDNFFNEIITSVEESTYQTKKFNFYDDNIVSEIERKEFLIENDKVDVQELFDLDESLQTEADPYKAINVLTTMINRIPLIKGVSPSSYALPTNLEETINLEEIYAKRARWYFNLDQIKEAKEDFSMAISVNPNRNESYLYHYLGICKMMLNEIDSELIRTFDKAIYYNNETHESYKISDSYYQRATVYYQYVLNQDERAKEDLIACLKLSPDDSSAKKLLNAINNNLTT